MNRLQSRRQNIGYIYPPQVNNNITTPTYRRDIYNVMRNDFKKKSDDMDGEGIMDIARGIYNKGKKLFGKASDLYSSEAGTAIKNLIPPSDETGRDAFSGEKHAILELKNGKFGMANYMGPGTQLVKRLRRGDPPRTKSDKVAMRHDIDYALASGLSNKEAQVKAIREADERMVSSLNRISNENGDSKKNIFQGRRLIQGKMAAEDAGLMQKGSFGGDLKKISDDDKILLMSKRAGLNQEGYGLPGQELKRKLIKQMRKKGGRMSKSKSYGTSKGYQLKGGFLSLLAPLLGTVARSVGTSLLGGVIGKIFGGDGISGDISKVLKSKVVGKIGNIVGKITHSDLPSYIINQAGNALEIMDKTNGGKNKIMAVAKMLMPHVKKAIETKIKGSGLGVAGGAMKTSDAKILKLINKDLSGNGFFENLRGTKSGTYHADSAKRMMNLMKNVEPMAK